MSHSPEADTPEQREARVKARLRAALDGLELDPDETEDDRLIRGSELAQRAADAQLLEDVPPHHLG